MKRILTLTLCILLVLCSVLTVFAVAAGSEKITGMKESLALGYSGSIDLGDVYPQDSRVERIYLYDSMFEWENHTPGETPAKLSSSQIRSAKLNVSSSSGRKVVDSVSINSRESCIEVTFIEEFVSTKEQDFDIDVYLTINGRRMSDYGVTLSGTLTNPVVEVYADEDTVDISDGYVAEAQENIPNIDVEIGNHVTVKTRMTKDKKIYGIVTMTPAGADERVMDQHRDIEEVLTLKTVGLNTSSNVIELGMAYRDYYVYNADLAYLGTGKDELPYSSKYYLSKKVLDIDDGQEVEIKVSGSDAPVDEPMTDTTPPNVNHNPGMGR